MNKIRKNALRIAELKGYQEPSTEIENAVIITPTVMENFMRYNGLMPIVFECNNTKHLIAIYYRAKEVQFLEYIDRYYCRLKINYNTEPEFIEAIQLAVIKYLELKNG